MQRLYLSPLCFSSRYQFSYFLLNSLDFLLSENNILMELHCFVVLDYSGSFLVIESLFLFYFTSKKIVFQLVITFYITSVYEISLKSYVTRCAVWAPGESRISGLCCHLTGHLGSILDFCNQCLVFTCASFVKSNCDYFSTTLHLLITPWESSRFWLRRTLPTGTTSLITWSCSVWLFPFSKLKWIIKDLF